MRLEFLADWGSTATFRDVSASSNSSITAMLKREYYEENSGDATVQSSSPVAHVRTSDVPSVVQGDTIAIAGTTYTIVEISPDNEGVSQLRLRI